MKRLIPRLVRLFAVGNKLLSREVYSCFAFLRLRVRGVKVGAGLKVQGWIDLEIHPLAKVAIGENVRINSGFSLNPVGGYRRTGIWVGRDATLLIGKDVGISNSTIVCMNSVTIGDEVLIGGDCKIYDTDFHPLDANDRVVHKHGSINTSAVSIGSRSFIGSHSLILKGVQIGSEAVVGAGSVVTNNVPQREIWAGVPARCIRKA